MDKDNYIITKSKDGSEWGLTSERGSSQFPLVDSNGDNLVIAARLNGVSWQTAKAVKELLMIEK